MSDHVEGQHMTIWNYVFVFFALVFGTIFTYYTSQMDFDSKLFPGANTLLALIIAFAKMACVILFFMHVKWSGRLIWLTVIGSFFWLAIMFAFTMQDYLTRSTGVFGQ